MKILFLTRFDFLEHQKDGGVLCSYRNFKMLSTLYGEENIFLCILTYQNRKSTQKATYIKVDGKLINIYINYIWLREGISRKTEKEIINCIQKKDVDLVFYDGSTFGQIICKGKFCEKNSIVFFHNVERQYTWEQVKKHNVLCIFRYFATRHNEKKMARYGKKIICLNDRDAELIMKFYKRNVDMVLPATFDDEVDDLGIQRMIDSKSKKNKLLYVGSYYAHNVTGLVWFINKVMPYIDAELTIVGKNMEKIKNQLSIPQNVNIVGTVEDLVPYYAEADAMVMPVFMGGGMKVKTAEALMYGKTIFGSTEALEGYMVQGVEGIFRCNTKEQFIKSINCYFQDKRNNKFNQQIRELFLNHYCTNGYLDNFKYVVERI